jgi:DNA-binding transcriptional MerR regulator
VKCSEAESFKNLRDGLKVMKEDSDRRLLRIGDVAGIVRVPVHTLRYWESMFKEIIQPYRSKGEQRRYSERDIEKIFEIKRLLKEEGYSISGAKRIFKNGEGKGELPLSCGRRKLNWSYIAQEVTELIRERLSAGTDQG